MQHEHETLHDMSFLEAWVNDWHDDLGARMSDGEPMGGGEEETRRGGVARGAAETYTASAVTFTVPAMTCTIPALEHVAKAPAATHAAPATTTFARPRWSMLHRHR